LGTYALPGRLVDPATLPDLGRDAEAVGLSSIWVSERWDQKEMGVMLGALGAVTSELHIGCGITHPNTRHPIILAAMGMTMQMLTGGRFELGFGRSAPKMWKTIGLPIVTTEVLRDIAVILSDLWARRPVSYAGALGRFPRMQMSHLWDGPPPPLLLGAVGPETLKVAGEVYDGVFLHAWMSPDAVAGQIVRAREAAETVGRNPDRMRFVATLVCAPGLPPERSEAVVLGRAITYFQVPGYGDMLVRANGWDPHVLEKVRSHPLFNSLRAEVASQEYTLEQLAAVGRLLPTDWVKAAACIGSAADVARKAQEYLDSGATEVVLHGNAPADLAPVVTEFQALIAARADASPRSPSLPIGA